MFRLAEAEDGAPEGWQAPVTGLDAAKGASHFTQGTICSRLTAERCVSISGRTLLRTSGGTKTEERLAEDAALLAAYCEHFGIVLSSSPADPAKR
jgi:N-hydroxyarylamine O-acetyltransferase